MNSNFRIPPKPKGAFEYPGGDDPSFDFDVTDEEALVVLISLLISLDAQVPGTIQDMLRKAALLDAGHHFRSRTKNPAQSLTDQKEFGKLLSDQIKLAREAASGNDD